MLNKCANPACSAVFRYFHEGRLFAMASLLHPRSNGQTCDVEYVERCEGVRYFWLCGNCSCSMTVQTDGGDGVRVVKKPDLIPNTSCALCDSSEEVGESRVQDLCQRAGLTVWRCV